MAAMIEHPIKWTTPSPLWASVANSGDATVRNSFGRPAILRFASDSFMEDFLKLLETDPAQIANLIAEYETWHSPTPRSSAQALLEPAEAKSSLARKVERIRLATARLRNGAGLANGNGAASAAPTANNLKLYQPAHQRFYLVASCLVCGIAGLPDRRLDAGKQERVSFVLRRFINPDQADAQSAADLNAWDEYAMVVTPRGTAWKKIVKSGSKTGNELIAGEEQQAMFNINFVEDDGRNRRLLAGLIPVGKREAFQNAPDISALPVGEATGTSSAMDTRMFLLRAKVTAPWKSLLEQADAVQNSNSKEQPPPPPTDPALLNMLKSMREQFQSASWYILLDFAQFLNTHLNRVWRAITEGLVLTDPAE